MEDKFSSKVNNPLFLRNMKVALNRIVKAINEREKIVIYGYHDFDSVCAVSLLMLVLKYLNSDVEYYIPNAHRNNIHLSKEDIEEKILCLGANLIITVGCGVNSNEELKFCSDNNIDTIAIDYHDHIVDGDNCILINTYDPRCKYPFKEFTAASLTYKFIEVIASYYKISCVSKYLDLVMMGVITMGTKISGENKYFMEEGHKKLQETNNYGIRALIKEHEKNYGDSIEFYCEGIRNLLPKMISCEKPDNARILVELFTTDNSYRAKQIAKYLYKEIRRKEE